MARSKIRARLAMNRTLEGPRILQEKTALRDRTSPVFAKRAPLALEYDFEHDDGSVEWARIAFEEAIYFEWRDEPCCRGDDVVSSHEIQGQDESELLRQVMAVWEQYTGRDEHQKALGGKHRFKHYTAYFDHAGCINVIASGCRVE